MFWIAKMPDLTRIPLMLGASAVISLSGCMDSDPTKNQDGGGSGVIKVVGRVVSGNGGPLAGMPVRLARAGLVDTTDALGRYRLEGEPVAEGLMKFATTAKITEVEDTLHFEQAGQPILSLEVSWVDSLPDVSIVQRGVTASLALESSAFARAEIVLWGNGISEVTPHVVQAFHNTLVGEISGFLYFPPSPPVREYSLYVRTVDSAGRVTGRSQTLPFSSLAGNLNLPAFRAGNAMPTVFAGNDTIVPLGTSSLLLKGLATDSFGGSISKWEWNIGGTGSFIQTYSGDTIIVVPDSVGRYLCVLKVTDNENNVVRDTMRISVLSGFNWLKRDSIGSTLSGVAWTGSHFVAVGNGGSIFTSSDGLVWVSQVSGTTQNLWKVAWVGGQLVAVGAAGSLLTSPDGMTWTARDPGTTEGLQGVAWANGRFVVVGGRGTVLTSTDGVAWTGSIISSTSLSSVVWAGNQFVAGGYSSAFYSSSDGLNWVVMSGGSTSVEAMVWTGNQFVTVGSTIRTSPDGVNWTARLGTGASSSQNAVVWTGKQLISVGSSGRVYLSSDGASWVILSIEGRPTLWSIAWSGSKFVTVGHNGIIMTSP